MKPKNQLSGVFSRRTMSLIFSVTLFSVCPGARMGTSPGPPGSFCLLISVAMGPVVDRLPPNAYRLPPTELPASMARAQRLATLGGGGQLQTLVVGVGRAVPPAGTNGSISGFGLRTAARYVVRGRVFSSASAP